MIENAVLKELVEKAAACKDGDVLALGALFLFLDENAGLALYEAACHEMMLREPNLTDKQREDLRFLGVSFYDEADKPIDFLVKHREEDGLPRDS